VIKKYLAILLTVYALNCYPLFSQAQSEQDNTHPAHPVFSKEYPTALIPDISDTYGVAFDDVNGDDWPDLYLVCFRGLNRLLINQGPTAPFQDATIGSGLGGNLMPQGIHNLELGANMVDVDNDGDGDVIIAGWGVTTTFFRNDGKLNFTNQNNTLHLPENCDANTCVAADINLDGHLDLFFTDEHFTNHMMLNLGNGSFEDITREAGLEFTGISQGAAFCDVDWDGDPDLYIANWEAPDLFYRNLGAGRFQKISLELEVFQESFNTNSVHFGDVDNDGDFDFFIANRQGRNFLYRNDTAPGDSNWIFTEIWEKNFGSYRNMSYGSVIADFNNDGWQDIFVTNIGPNRFYRNSGKEHFELVYTDPKSTSGGVPGYSTGAAYADADCDGDLDLFVANKDTFSILYPNPTNDDRWIQFRVQGIRSNRDAIGTRVEIYRSGYLEDPQYLLGTREISGGQGYLSLSSPIVHFGLDTTRQVDARFRFPSGKILRKRNLHAGRFYAIHEYPWLARQIVFTKQIFFRLIRSPYFWKVFSLICLFFLITFIFLSLGVNRYQWRTRTLSLFLGLFFVIVFTITFLFKPLPRTHMLLALNVLMLTITSIIAGLSERLVTLRKSREKYRSVLIHLSNQILHIHDDRELYHSIIDGIAQNSNFTICGILRFDEENQFRESIFRGREIPLDQINNFQQLDSLILILREKGSLVRKQSKSLASFFDIVSSELIVAIQTEDRFYGCLLLGSDRNHLKIETEDITLFQTLSNQMAVSLTINAYIAQASKMIKAMTEVEVREKHVRELEAVNTDLDEKNQELKKLFEELKQTESQLIQSEKMASLGRLVAGITHELNNPIGFIYANVKQLQSYMCKIEKAVPTLKEVSTGGAGKIRSLLPDIQNTIEDTIKGSKMVKTLLENLKKFSHLDQAYWKKSNIHEGIETSLMILKPELKARIQIHKKLEAKGILECNIGQLNQVFLNLLNNAVQAIKGEGGIWIRTFDENKNLIIEIRDNGPGIPKEIHQKIFDPSISYAIIQKHGGEITFDSKRGEGTTFRILLPYS